MVVLKILMLGERWLTLTQSEGDQLNESEEDTLNRKGLAIYYRQLKGYGVPSRAPKHVYGPGALIVQEIWHEFGIS